MSRSNYSDDLDNWAMIKWRGAVTSAIRGKRGQRFLRELADEMDAMQTKELIANELEQGDAHCALGVVGVKRGVNMTDIDPEDPEQVAKAFDLAYALACEIAYVNDEAGPYGRVVDGKWIQFPETPAERWIRVRAWLSKQIKMAAKLELQGETK